MYKGCCVVELFRTVVSEYCDFSAVVSGINVSTILWMNNYLLSRMRRFQGPTTVENDSKECGEVTTLRVKCCYDADSSQLLPVLISTKQ